MDTNKVALFLYKYYEDVNVGFIFTLEYETTMLARYMFPL